jgi:hypothetical protein
VTNGTVTPPYVTDVASVTPLLAFVHTATVTPEAVPPGVCVHSKNASEALPVVLVWASDAPR